MRHEAFYCNLNKFRTRYEKQGLTTEGSHISDLSTEGSFLVSSCAQLLLLWVFREDRTNYVDQLFPSSKQRVTVF